MKNIILVTVFGFDVAEISQIRRIRSFSALGLKVQSFTMRRKNMNKDFKPDWPNVHLYETENEKLLKRFLVIFKSLFKMLAHRKALHESDVIIARNLDMLCIAWFSKVVLRLNNTPLIYECLDINSALCGNRYNHLLLRWVERFLLRRIQLLVVSSPAFLTEYFCSIQSFQGKHYLLENKLALSLELPSRPRSNLISSEENDIVLGWVGTIRCKPTFDLLVELSRQLEKNISIKIFGVVHEHCINDFFETIEKCKNISFYGPYEYPQDLAKIYQSIDLVWAQDLWQRDTNSKWLLPNRIYEASWAGCPSLALADTETGRRISQDKLGWVIDSPTSKCLVDFLSTITKESLSQKRAELLLRSSADFIQSKEDLQKLFETLSDCRVSFK
ncbi:glycosyl transferase [Donghicola mangrovi]|uniref:glycosyl transferase n=1 Tax=Donghicola mangrovi TaxID=2729614 RepID=UPI001D158701|nr:glycosyl transferase [Donghicola mangrovi]